MYNIIFIGHSDVGYLQNIVIFRYEGLGIAECAQYRTGIMDRYRSKPST